MKCITNLSNQFFATKKIKNTIKRVSYSFSSESFLTLSLVEIVSQEFDVCLVLHSLLTSRIFGEYSVWDLDFRNSIATIVASKHEASKEFVAIEITVLVNIDLIPCRLGNLLCFHHGLSTTHLHTSSHSHSHASLHLHAHSLLSHHTGLSLHSHSLLHSKLSLIHHFVLWVMWVKDFYCFY